jgi:hypothetical protein
MSVREVVEGLQIQGADEAVTYSITTTSWASSPSSPVVEVRDVDAHEAVTGDVTSGAASVAGDIITLPAISGLTADTLYRVDVQFTAGEFAPAECFFYIRAEE